jgi:hypothetical protein
MVIADYQYSLDLLGKWQTRLCFFCNKTLIQWGAERLHSLKTIGKRKCAILLLHYLAVTVTGRRRRRTNFELGQKKMHHY